MAFAVTCLTASIAAAQPAQVEARAAYRADGTLVRLISTSAKKKSAVTLHVGKAAAVTIHAGDATGTLAVGHDRVVVALAVDDAKKPFRIVVLDGDERAAPVALARGSDRHDIPFAVAATPTPDGFTVFFQEIETDDPTNAHTYMATLDKTGKPTGDAKEIAVPWSLGAAAWNGKGYHLALFYPGDGRGMRLSMVSLTAAGSPEQHPDWASRAAFPIGDVHLVAANGKIRAFYRAGARLLESDVTAIRDWGSEPPKAKDHGALSQTKAIAITAQLRPAKVAGTGK
jgi:hypothetical protein